MLLVLQVLALPYRCFQSVVWLFGKVWLGRAQTGQITMGVNILRKYNLQVDHVNEIHNMT